MITKRQGGLTELIPSPQEKREGVLRDHALELLANLDARLRRIETHLGLSPEEAEAFRTVMAHPPRGNRGPAHPRRTACGQDSPTADRTPPFSSQTLSPNYSAPYG